MALTGTQQLFDLVEKARAAALKCPGGVVTGAAGLVLADCELPPRLEKLACEAPVQISLPRARSYFHDVPAHRHAVPAGPWLTIDRVQVASPGDCLAQLGADRVAAGYKPPWSGLVPWESLSRRGKVNRLRRILGLASPKPRLADFRVDPDRAFLELVMAADSLMREKGPRLSKAELAASVESLSRRPGSRAARMAVALSEPRTASNPETWTRIVLLDAGLPRGIPNDRVEDPRGGTTRFIDVRVEGYRIGIEYQGGYHFEKAEVGYEDMVRREQLRELGWVMVEAGRRDGPDQSRLVRRVAIEIARIERLRLPSPQG